MKKEKKEERKKEKNEERKKEKKWQSFPSQRILSLLKSSLLQISYLSDSHSWNECDEDSWRERKRERQ